MRHSTRFPKKPFAFDLHVLSTPPAFVLSQDQTLQFDILNRFPGSLYKRAHNSKNYENSSNDLTKEANLGPFAGCCYSVFKDHHPLRQTTAGAAVRNRAEQHTLPYTTHSVNLIFCPQSSLASNPPGNHPAEPPAVTQGPRQTT